MNGDYPAIWINDKSVHIHRLEWMKHHGKIPKGYIVHHKDENKLNWSIDNLELITRSEHLKKHKNIVKRPGIKVIARKDELELTFDSIEQAAEFCGTYTACLNNCFKGKQKQSNGWTFERG
jgi:hypothetical protein